MRGAILILSLLLAAGPGWAGAGAGAGGTAGVEQAPAPIALPSGQEVTLDQVIWPAGTEGPGDRRLRLRFVAPRIARDAVRRIDAGAAEEDLLYLCNHVALPALRRDGRAVDEIVITLMARRVPFGVADPKVRQFIDTFLIEGDHCQWEGL